MNEVIQWCNDNNGFLTAILSFLGLLLSVIAIVVSIRTARLPYRKGLRLGFSYNILFSKNIITSQANTQMAGISVTAVNVGARDINISFLGLAVKDKSLGKSIQKMVGITSDIGGKGVLHSTELNEAVYSALDLIQSFSRIPNAKVFLYATDTEGQIYCRRFLTAQNIIDHLTN